MTAHEETSLLIQLQRIDSRLSKFNETQLSYQKKIESERSVLEVIKNKVGETKSQLDEVAKERRDKEGEIEIQEQQILKTQSRLKEIKTNKEYQAHLHEIDALKKGRTALEDAVLLLMDKMEILKNEAATEEQEFKEKEAKYLETVKAIEVDMAKLKEDKQKLEQERSGLSSQVSKKILAQYDHLLMTKKGSAIVGLNGNTCLGCYMNLPPQLVAEVKKNEKLLTCSHCYRILYWPDLYFPKTA